MITALVIIDYMLLIAFAILMGKDRAKNHKDY